LPWRAGETAPRSAEVNAFFAHAGQQRIETLAAPAWAALDTLRKRATAIVSGRPAEGQLPAVIILSSAGELEGSLTLDQLIRLKPDDGTRRLADRTVVVVARLGGLSEDGLLDASVADAPTTLDGTAGLDPGHILILSHEAGQPPPAVTSGAWTRAYGWTSRYDADGDSAEEVIVYIAEAARVEPALARQSQTLDEHSSAAERKATAIAARLGLAEELTHMLVGGAGGHDTGKRREIWQSAFSAPVAGRPYAKTAAKWVNQALLGGYRHEFGSLADAEANSAIRALPEDLRQLALHLIAAHHGQGRPLIIPLDPEAPPSALQARAADVAMRFATLQRQWGPWGLAWWEMLLRAADAAASRDNDGTQA
jgi:CRISPR-associated endonuclease/helicase Cas3